MSPLEPNLDAGDLFGVKGLNVVITGGGGDGLGAMMARALAQNGANKIFVLGRRQAALEETVKSCPEGVVVPVQGDVTSKDSLAKAAEQVASQVDHLDVVVANSGILGPSANIKDNPNPTLTELRDHWWSIPMEDFSQTSHVNVTGVFYTVLAFLPLLQKANELRPPPSAIPRPQVIVVTSVAGYSRSINVSVAYSVSKAGAEHLSKMLATKLTPFKIRVNALVPGPFMSELTQNSYQGNQQKTRGVVEGDKPIAFIPLERAGSEEDIAGAMLYMCSRAGAFLSGNSIVLDGGRLSNLPASY